MPKPTPRQRHLIEVPQHLLAEATRLIPAVQRHQGDIPPLAAAGRISRAAIIRAALVLGMEQLRRLASAALPPQPKG